MQIAEKEKKIKAYEVENEKLEKRITSLKEATYPSEEETQKAEDTILKAQKSDRSQSKSGCRNRKRNRNHCAEDKNNSATNY